MAKTRYAKGADGSHIASRVTGDGPMDVLMMPLGFIPIDAAWEEPSLARFLRRLGSFSRLVRFDFLGVAGFPKENATMARRGSYQTTGTWPSG